METIQNTIDFFTSYPPRYRAALLLCLVVSAAILIFAPRDQKAEVVGPLILEMGQVTLFGNYENPVVRVVANVDGETFEHPSVAGAAWMQVGPNMDKKTVELPNEEIGRLSFSIVLREGQAIIESADRNVKLYAYDGKERFGYSQMLTYIEVLPFEGKYMVFEQLGDTRQLEPMAEISFRVFRR